MNGPFGCSVCQIKLQSNAELAIHEFSKKHCDNLLRVSKNKPVKGKSEKKAETAPEQPANPVNVCTEPGNFALYGYFTAAETTNTGDGYEPREYNYDYDPYLQKLAEVPKPDPVNPLTPNAPTTNVTSFQRSKKKKKARSCQVCNVTLVNIPEYEAHMKSAQHVWKLKMSGMGVSAHFVKASTDLHTTEGSEDHTDESPSVPTVQAVKVPIAPSDLFCEVCDVLLNSQLQFDNHVAGKAHQDRVNRKEATLAKKEKSKVPVPNELFCYSCELPLNNVNQFKDHINGKKHKIKCRKLIREGFAVPPEERTIDMTWAVPQPGRSVVYPKLYMATASSSESKDTSAPTEVPSAVSATATAPKPEHPINRQTGMYHCTQCPFKCSTSSRLGSHILIHSKGNAVSLVPPKPVESAVQPEAEAKTVPSPQPENPFYQCRLCEKSFRTQPPFEEHLNSEQHALTISESRKKGKTLTEILDVVLADRGTVLPDRYGRYCCGICAVMSNGPDENTQHLQSLLHKYALRDYKKKRIVEIQEALAAVPNDQGHYACKHCSVSHPTLTEHNAHLHSSTHKQLFWQQHMKRLSLRRGKVFKRFIHRALGWRTKEPKNPGIRTKVGGIATDLSSGDMQSVPNFEALEPKIDPVKNLAIGADVKPAVKKKPKPALQPARRRPGMMFLADYELMRPPLMERSVPPPRPMFAPRPPPQFRNFNRFHPYRPRGEMFPPRGEMFPPRGEMFHPRDEMFPPRGEMFPPRGEMFHPRDEMFSTRDEMFPSRGEMFHPRDEMFPPRGEMFPPRGYPPMRRPQHNHWQWY